MSPRDLFFSRLFFEPEAWIVTTDFGCQALDEFKKINPDRFINVGIAEQNAILVATGLALEGKRVFVYGIASFITMRCLDQIRVCLDGMDLPVTIVGVGIEDDYKDAGYTHWAYEDVGIMQALKNVKVYEVKEPFYIPGIVEDCLTLPHPKYVRLRRK
jgi:transketolase